MLDFSEDPELLIILAIIIVFIIIAAVGIYHHNYKAGFKPIFRAFSDGSVQMEFMGFGLKTVRTKRFYEQYTLGMSISYQGQLYKIVEFKEQPHYSLLQSTTKIVAYLEKV